MAFVFSGYTYPARKIVPLNDEIRQGASGEAVFEKMGIAPGQRSVGIDLFGLKPDAIYSVWLEKNGEKRERMPLGVDINHFKTNASGKGRYVTTASEYDVEYNWDYLIINYHPDGDPKNTENMVTELRGDLKYGYHS